MLMLVDCLNRRDALDIEERLCTWALDADEDSHIFRKFALNGKGTRHWRNHGGTNAEKEGICQGGCERRRPPRHAGDGAVRWRPRTVEVAASGYAKGDARPGLVPYRHAF